MNDLQLRVKNRMLAGTKRSKTLMLWPRITHHYTTNLLHKNTKTTKINTKTKSNIKTTAKYTAHTQMKQ